MDFASIDNSSATNLKIKVIGVGGAGCNALYKLMMENIDGVEFCAIDTDSKMLEQSTAQEKILIGKRTTRGMSSGGNSNIGMKSAMEDSDAIKSSIGAVDLLFIITGLGGGTGSGAAPVIAKQAYSQGTKVITFCTLPFEIEGTQKKAEAIAGLKSLSNSCDATIPLPNEVLIKNSPQNMNLMDAFLKADTCMSIAVRSISTMLLKTGLINIDFAVIKSLFENKSKKTLFGIGIGMGENCVADALDDLIKCPLLNLPQPSEKADSLLVNVTCAAGLGMNKLQHILEYIANIFSANEKVRIGATIDESYSNKLEICVLGVSGSTPLISAAQQIQIEPVKQPVRYEENKSRRSKVVSKIKNRIMRDKYNNENQQMFAFAETAQQRGFFEDTPKNTWMNEDLDVPTFMRRGIKIHI